MFALIIEPIKEWWRMRRHREPYADILFRERLRAHAEIVSAASDVSGVDGRRRLAEVRLRNSMVLSAESMRLPNRLVMLPPEAEPPGVEYATRFAQLFAHLRNELRVDAIDVEELQEIIRAPKQGQDQEG
jgi:hypothetical protein